MGNDDPMISAPKPQQSVAEQYAALQADAAALHTGRWKMIVAMVVAVLLAVAAAVFFLAGDDDKNALREFGRSVTGMKHEKVDGFWRCVLQGGDVRDLERDFERFRSELDRRAQRGGPRFSALVRDTCLPMLADAPEAISSLIPPPDLADELRDLTPKINGLRSAFSDFNAYLDSEGGYDSDRAEEYIRHIGEAWVAFLRSYKDLNDKLAAKLR